MPSLRLSVNKGSSGGSRRSSSKGNKGAPPPPEDKDDDDSMMAEAMAVITEFDQKKPKVAQQQTTQKKPSPGRPGGSPRSSAASSASSSRKSAPTGPSTSSQKKQSPPKPDRGNRSSRRSLGTKQPSTRSTASAPNKQRVKNKIGVNSTSGSTAVRRAADSVAATSSSSYRSGRMDGAAAAGRKSGHMSVDHSASTFATTHKASPRTSPDKKKMPQKQPQKQQSMKQRPPNDSNDGKLGSGLGAMVQRGKVGDGRTSSRSNRATTANVSARSGMTAGTEEMFMSKFVSDPTGETDDAAVSKRSIKSNAPSVSASVMLNAIDPSRAAYHDGDDATAFDDGTLTLDGSLAVADDSSTLLGDDSSTVGELVQTSSRDSTTFGSRVGPVAAGAAAVAVTAEEAPAAATAQPKSTLSITSSIKTRKIKNKHNVTVIGLPSPPPSESSVAGMSATTAGALNGDAASAKATEASDSGLVSSSSPTKPLAPVASRDSDSTPSVGAVSSATAVSAATRSVLSAQSSRSVHTALSRVPDIDLNADDGSLTTTGTNMTGATELNRRLKASIETGKSSKLENIIGVLGEDDPLSKALRDAEDKGAGEVVVATAAAEATAVAEAQTSSRSIKSMLSRKSMGSASQRKEASPSPAPVGAGATHPSRPPEQDKDASSFSEQAKAAAVVGAIASSVGDLNIPASTENLRALDGSSMADGSSSVANTEATQGSSKKAVMRRGIKQGCLEEEGYFPTSKRSVVRGNGSVASAPATAYAFRNEESTGSNGSGATEDRALEEGDGLKPIDHESKPTWQDDESFFKRNQKSLLIGIGFLAVIGAIVGIAVAASAKKKTGDAGDPSREGGDIFEGTPAPTPFLTLDSMLSMWSPDGGEAMKTLPFSPQGMAYAWIKTDIELLGYDPDDLSESDFSSSTYAPRRTADRVRTRYALSVLNYTFWGGAVTAGVSTDVSDEWSHGNDECIWARLSCEDDTGNDSAGIVRVLDLEEAEIPEGSVLPGEVSMLKSLLALVLTTTRVGGSIPDVFGPMKELRELDLDDCVFTGFVPSSIGALQNLEELRLNDNILEGPLPDLFWNLNNLRVLELQKNLFTGTISESIWSLENIEDLRFGDNELTGSVSTQIGNLKKLERFWAYTNQLTGRIPTQMGQLTFLRDLSMDDNRLVGAIPKQLAALPLQELWLNVNKLSSAIPTEFGEMFGLENLYLDENVLTGFIPFQLGNLYNCTDVFLNNNKLIGVIPDTFGDMESLQRLRVHANSLSGSVPDSLCRLDLEQLTADCADLPQLGVLVSCPLGCCTECF